MLCIGGGLSHFEVRESRKMTSLTIKGSAHMLNIDPTSLRPDFKWITGTEETTIDDKGRIAISKSKRERLGAKFALTIGAENCLIAYPLFVFEQILKQLSSASKLGRGSSWLLREFIGNADSEVAPDAQGRFVVQKRLRELAKLSDKIIVKGCGDFVEIWSSAEYANYLKDEFGYEQERREKFDRALAEISQRGI